MGALAEQLSHVYLEKETWHRSKLSWEDAVEYHQRLLDRGNIITVQDNERLVGYAEIWRLNDEQLERVLGGGTLAADAEDVQTGCHAYVANIYIEPEYRHGEVFKLLKRRFFELCGDCVDYSGEARTKEGAPLIKFRNREMV